MFYSWIEDKTEKHDFAKNYSILSGSFANPKMASDMLGNSPNHYKAEATDFDFSFKEQEELLLHSIAAKPQKRNKKKFKAID